MFGRSLSMNKTKKKLQEFTQKINIVHVFNIKKRIFVFVCLPLFFTSHFCFVVLIYPVSWNACYWLVCLGNVTIFYIYIDRPAALPCSTLLDMEHYLESTIIIIVYVPYHHHIEHDDAGAGDGYDDDASITITILVYGHGHRHHSTCCSTDASYVTWMDGYGLGHLGCAAVIVGNGVNV